MFHAYRVLSAAVSTAVSFGTAGCCDRAPVPSAAEDAVFYVSEAGPMQLAEGVIATDRVVAAGHVERGTIRKGDTAVVQLKSGPARVTVRPITNQTGERLHESDQTSTGDQAALELQGIGPKAEWADDRVRFVGSSRQHSRRLPSAVVTSPVAAIISGLTSDEFEKEVAAMRATSRAWAAFAAGFVGLLAGLALDRALFWTVNSFRVVLALPMGLLAAAVCYWAVGGKTA